MLAEDFEGMEDMFETAQSTRSNIPRNQKGFLQPLADIYVRVADEPGILHTLTGHLVDADLNIKDVELQRYREGTGGTFRLSFDSDEDAEAAAAVLSDAGYTARRPD
jgi:prephenate dehydrogenase